MRGKKGKVICVWSPMQHGEGCTTLACSLGFGLHLKSRERILIVNKSDSIAGMEKLVEKDIAIKYSLDNLKIFNEGIRAEHILTYATHINSNLHMLAGSRLDRKITGVGTEFDRLFLEGCTEGYELTIVDLGTGTDTENSMYLEYADTVIAVVTPNEIMLDRLFSDYVRQAALDYFSGNKAVVVVNKLCSDWNVNSVIGRYRDIFSMDRVYGVSYDGELLSSGCIDRSMYSFFVNKFSGRKSECMQQLNQLCCDVADKLGIIWTGDEVLMPGSLFSRFRRISLY
ncbi:MAG: hypothetical protein ACM3ZR_06575 [Pseudomonadota bacterium]